MAVIKIWARTASSGSMTALPSPVSIQTTREQIWSEDTGRAQSGANQAEMIGTSVAEKMTYAIKWGVLDSTDFNTIVTNLPKGFFYFGVAQTEPSSPSKYYRSEITYDIIQAMSNGALTTFYKDVSVSVIQK